MLWSRPYKDRAHKSVEARSVAAEPFSAC